MGEIRHVRALLDERTVRFEEAMRALGHLLDERYETQTKALDAAFVAAEKAVATALASAEKATDKAEAAAIERADAHNGLLQKMEAQGATFVSRAEFDAKVEALDARVSELIRAQEHTAGQRSGATATRAALVTAAGLFLAIIGAVITILTLNN